MASDSLPKGTGFQKVYERGVAAETSPFADRPPLRRPSRAQPRLKESPLHVGVHVLASSSMPAYAETPGPAAARAITVTIEISPAPRSRGPRRWNDLLGNIAEALVRLDQRVLGHDSFHEWRLSAEKGSGSDLVRSRS